MAPPLLMLSALCRLSRQHIIKVVKALSQGWHNILKLRTKLKVFLRMLTGVTLSCYPAPFLASSTQKLQLLNYLILGFVPL